MENKIATTKIYVSIYPRLKLEVIDWITVNDHIYRSVCLQEMSGYLTTWSWYNSCVCSSMDHVNEE